MRALASWDQETAAQQLEQALQDLAQACPRAAHVLRTVGAPQPRVRPHSFATLLNIIVAQQVSTQSAAAIWTRCLATLGEDPQPQDVAALDEAAMRALGLSRPKQRYAQALAQAVLGGQLDLTRLPQLDDAAAIEQLTKVTGIGRWSADIYLMFALGRGDVWPADDLALQVGLQRLFALDQRPKARRQSEALIAAWRPYRSAGALLVWKYYGAATLETA